MRELRAEPPPEHLTARRLAGITGVTDQVAREVRVLRDCCRIDSVREGAEDATTFAFRDIDPGSDGHLLVIPKRHSADLLEISAEDLDATTLAAQRIAKVALSELRADVVNLLNCSGARSLAT